MSDWLHYPEEYQGPWDGDGHWMRLTETTCSVGCAWIGIEHPKVTALMEWLEFHGIEDPRNTVALSTSDGTTRTQHPIERLVEECQVRYVHREHFRTKVVIQGEAPPLPWPSILWAPDGYLDSRRPNPGSKEDDHERPAEQPDTDGSQRRRLGVADHHPDRAGDHRADHLHRADGDRPRRLAPVTLDALGVSPGGLG